MPPATENWIDHPKHRRAFTRSKRAGQEGVPSFFTPRPDPIEQLNVRLSDKRSRLARGDAAGKGVEWDILGYLLLKPFKIADGK